MTRAAIVASRVPAAGSEPGLSPSLWTATAEAAPETHQLDSDRPARVAIVGAGYTGCSAALHLAERGVEVVVLEAGAIGQGGSGRNMGQVNAGAAALPDEVERRLGPERGARLNQALGSSPDMLFALVERHRIACDRVRPGNLTLAHSAAGLKVARDKFEQHARRAAPVEWLDRAAVREAVGSARYLGGFIDRRAGTLQPLSYARGLARAALAAGAAIHTGSRVTALARDGGTWRVTTARANVSAEIVIVATDSYSDGLWPGASKSLVPVSVLLAATEPLGPNLRPMVLAGGHATGGTERLPQYYRTDRDGRLIVGTLASEPAPGSVLDRWPLRAITSTFPHLADQRIAFQWSGVVGMSRWRIPRLHEPAPGVLIPIGYSGRGLAPGTLMGKLLAERILGADERDLPVPMTPVERLPFRRLRASWYELGSRGMRLAASIG